MQTEEEKLECIVCLNELEAEGLRIPRVFPCRAGHTFCTDCILTLKTCPICQDISQVAIDNNHLPPPNLVRMELIRAKRDKQDIKRSSFCLTMVGFLICLFLSSLFYVWGLVHTIKQQKDDLHAWRVFGGMLLYAVPWFVVPGPFAALCNLSLFGLSQS